MNTFAYPLPIGYQNIINSLIKHMLKDVVSGLSRRKQGFDSPWGYQPFKYLQRFPSSLTKICGHFVDNSFFIKNFNSIP